MSNIIQLGGYLGALLSKLVGPVMKIAAALAKNITIRLNSSSFCSRSINSKKDSWFGQTF